MADQQPPECPIAMSRPARKKNPPAKLIDKNNSATPALSFHREEIATYTAQKMSMATPPVRPSPALLHNLALPAAPASNKSSDELLSKRVDVEDNINTVPRKRRRNKSGACSCSILIQTSLPMTNLAFSS